MMRGTITGAAGVWRKKGVFRAMRLAYYTEERERQAGNARLSGAEGDECARHGPGQGGGVSAAAVTEADVARVESRVIQVPGREGDDRAEERP